MQIKVGAVSDQLAAVYSKLRSARSQAEFCSTYETYLSSHFLYRERIFLRIAKCLRNMDITVENSNEADKADQLVTLFLA